jgi:lysozyme family protein
MTELFEDWMDRAGTTDRVPAAWEAIMHEDPHEQVLRRAGFQYVGDFDFSVEQTWRVEALTGFVYRTSFLNTDALGDKLRTFERALADRLLSCEPGGTFQEFANYAYQLARKPR